MAFLLKKAKLLPLISSVCLNSRMILEKVAMRHPRVFETLVKLCLFYSKNKHLYRLYAVLTVQDSVFHQFIWYKHNQDDQICCFKSSYTAWSAWSSKKRNNNVVNCPETEHGEAHH